MSDGDTNDIPKAAKDLITRLYYDCMKSKRNQTVKTNDTSQLYCPIQFDGYACWPATSAGSISVQPCPAFVTGFDPKLYAHKKCLDDGTWFQHPESNRDWSNYTTCVNVGDLEFRALINDIYMGGYILSFITLMLSLCIFLTIRSLRCTRIRIHIHLFSSLALSCFFWIVWYKMVVGDPEIIKFNPAWCIGLHLLLEYLVLASYFWMFCEGLHLHLVLVVVFVKDTLAMHWFVAMGWVTPIIFVVIYGFVRASMTPDSEHCWIEEDSRSMWVLIVPVLISLAASMIFLINVVRVLFKKLHPCSSQSAPLALRKAARATLILVPLFGLHNVLLPLRPEAGAPMDKFYQFLSALLVSLQGFCVSCLFCFANHDVLHALRGFFNRLIPAVLKSSPEHNNNAQQATQTRDVIV